VSRYKKDGKYNINRLTNNEEEFYLEYATKYINEYYSPAKSFTIDLAKLDNGNVVIIEYNGINTSGMYEINSKALFSAIMENT
jgi:hypothetical protein